jgi:6-phosphogluconolactonase
MSSPHIVVCPSPNALAARAAGMFRAAATEAIRDRQRFTVALSGGSTPEKMYQLLAGPEFAKKIDWQKVYLFLGDERFVPDGDPRANWTMVRRSLLEKTAVPADHLFPLQSDLPDPAAAADAYTAILARSFGLDPTGPPPRFDLILLGLGDDGHTASLFPGKPALGVTDAWVTSSPPGVLPPPVDRVTFTYPTINAARQVLFLVAGANKVEPVRDVLEGTPTIEERPAVGVRPTDGTLTWLLDAAAAAGLSHKAG